MNKGTHMIKKVALILIAGAFVSTTVVNAQAVDAAKQTGSAISETAKEGAANAKAATESGPGKVVDKTKAAVHKTKAKYHKHKAKKAADAALH